MSLNLHLHLHQSESGLVATMSTEITGMPDQAEGQPLMQIHGKVHPKIVA